MASVPNTTRAPSALLAILAAALIGTAPIIAAALIGFAPVVAAIISAPSAEVAR